VVREDLLKQVAEHEWMHTIDLGDGVITPGRWPRNPNIVRAFDDIDFTGKKVLDVGTCNGIWSFEAEQRGATEVYSVAYLTHNSYWCKPAYDLAHGVLESSAVYNPDLNVYDVAKLGVADFDVVVFCGIYYHLKYPLLALMRMREVMKSGARIIIEGPVYANDDRAYASYHYKDVLFGDRSNWWTPSRRCLREWVESQFFEIVDQFENPEPTLGWMGRSRHLGKRMLGRDVDPIGRVVLVADAVTRKDDLYPLVDDEIMGMTK